MSIPPGSLVAQYDLNNLSSYPGTGNILYDLTATNADITLSNTSYYDGVSYNSLIFTKAATSTGTFTGNLGLGTTTPIFTFFMWVKPVDVTNGVGYSWFISYGKEDGSVGGAPMILPYYGYTQKLVTGFGSGFALIDTATALTLNEWVCLATTCDGTTYKLYKNGTFVSSHSLSGATIVSPQVLALNYLTGNPGLGCLDYDLNYLNIYDSALSAGDITTLYNSTKTRFPLNSYDFSDPACYPGTGNTVFDLTSNALNLPIVNATYGGSGQSQYFNFDGNGDYIGKTNVTGLGNTFTANMWYEVTAVNSTARSLWQVGVNSASGTNPGFVLNHPSAADLIYGFSFGVGTTSATGVLTANTWQMGTVTADGTTTKIYVDGVLAGSVAQGIGNWATGGFAIGAGVNGGGNISAGADGFLGNFAILDIYSSALGSTDITNIYNNTVDRFFPPLVPVASYDFSDTLCYPGSGSTVFDLEGSLDLPIVNATYGGTGQSKYFNFTGANQYIGKTNVTGFGLTFTINMWARQNANNTILHSFNGGVENYGPAMYWNDGAAGNIAPSFNNGQNKIVASGIATSEWYLTSYVLDGTNAKLYVDGSLIGSVAQAGGVAWQNGVFVLAAATDGSGNINTAGYFVGDIAIFDVYNTALSAGNITTYYNDTETRFNVTPPVTPTLIGSYDFSDITCWPGSGNTVFDLTAEANDLTLSGPSGGAVTFGGTGQSKYASFNGDTTYLYRSQFSSSGSTFGGGDFTLSVWHNYNNPQSNQAIFIMGGNGAAGSGIQLQVNGDDSNKITAAFGIEITEGGQLIGNSNTSTTWHMSTVTGDGTLLKLYQDGALIGSTSEAGTWDGRGFIIGRGLGASYQPAPVGPGFRYAGEIGIAEVYNAALGSTDISDLYDLQSPRFVIPSYAGSVGGRQFNQGFNG